MKPYFIYLVVLFTIFSTLNTQAQNITFTIENKIAAGGSVTFDVLLASDTPFKLGSGQLYFNYNTAAFNENVVAGSSVNISRPAESVLGQTVSFFSIYTSFVLNDNTNSRFSFSWQQGVSSGTIPADNITSTPTLLFRVRMDFASGGELLSDDICFESSDVFDDQTFTACGPSSSGFADCAASPGSQLTGDVFDCMPASLPVELVDFDAWATPVQQVELNWQTESELDNDYFAIERSADGLYFKEITRTKGAGTYLGTLDYKALDERPFIGDNYYRLRQVDFDGTTTYTEIRHVFLERSKEPIAVSVYPNPTDSWLQIAFTQPLAQEGQLELYNLAGQIVQSIELEAGAFQQELNLIDLAKGTYLLRVHMDDQIRTQKVVVQ